MRKLKLQVQVSADGFVCSPNNEQTFMKWDSGEDHIACMEKIWSTVDLVLMGSGMAPEFNDHWLQKAETPGDKEHAWGKLFTNIQKRVFSKTLTASDPKAARWKNISFTNADLVQEINRLKNEPGKDIITYGGARFAASLVQHNLVDEYYLFYHPTAIGKGKSIFQRVEGKLELKLAAVEQFEHSLSLLKYVPA